LPEGPGKNEVARLCAGCHDLTFTISTRETEAEWTRIVNDMRSRGADGTEEEFAKVITYLTAHMGKAASPVGHAKLELLANRTKVAPGERFAVGLRLVAADGWRVKGGGSPHVSWTTPQSLVIGDPARPVAVEPATLTVLPAVVSTSAVPGSTLDLTARVTYDVCRETCLTEAATASIELPVGEGGTPSHEEAFATARIASPPR
jgi:DsbC/DsbD-like thiol-disulfide interchange protein